MKKWARDVRLMPIVLMAIVCLFVLKSMGLLFDGGYTLGQRLGSGGTLTVTTVPVAQTQQMRSPSVPLEMPPQPGAREAGLLDAGDVRLSGRRPVRRRKPAAIPTSPARSRPSPPRRKDGKKRAPANKEPQRCRSAPKASPPAAPWYRSISSAPASPAERALLERLQERRQELEARARELSCAKAW